jgi:hypothetical protein
MRRLSSILLAAAAVLSAGCYRVTVVSGAPAAATPAVDVPWAHGFVYGLVPPSPLNVSQQCPQGVATVVTQQSLLNGLAQFLTWSLYSPQQITVTCASGPVRTSAAPAPAATVATAGVDSTAVVAPTGRTKR